MTQDIIEIGVQAGIQREVLMLGRNLELLINFAKLVAAKEREACAKLCDAELKEFGEFDADVKDVAKAIRARGQEC